MKTWRNSLVMAFFMVGLATAPRSLAGPEETDPGIDSVEALLGWESRYFYRGRWFGDESVWMELSASRMFSAEWSGTFSLFHTDVVDRAVTFSESQIGASVSYDAGFGFFDLGISHYRFHDGFGGNGSTLPVLRNRDATEAYVTYSAEIWGGFSFHGMLAHDFRIGGSYGELGIGRKWKLGSQVDLGLSAVTGYSLDDYYSSNLGNGDQGRGPTHSLVTVTLPWEIRDGLTLVPHLSAHVSHAAREASNAQGDREDLEFFGGAALSLRF